MLARAARLLVDFALPPRCPGCGAITADLDAFCGDCWALVEWQGGAGCATCGIALEATEADQCARCLASPPRIARTRAAMAYGDIARSMVLKLKYSRKVGLARTLARYMAPHVAGGGDAVLVPVPLHRGRLWWRGFNQSALIARQLARQTGLGWDPALLRRARRTRRLKGMSAGQRSREVRAAFAVPQPEAVRGRRIVLVDDVLTSGATSDACARALLKAGATRVELVCFARVVRPALLER